jgi:hypothetical protein
MSEVARTMVKAGLLDAGSVERYLLPVYARTPAEARAPLERQHKRVASSQSELRVTVQQHLALLPSRGLGRLTASKGGPDVSVSRSQRV